MLLSVLLLLFKGGKHIKIGRNMDTFAFLWLFPFGYLLYLLFILIKYKEIANHKMLLLVVVSNGFTDLLLLYLATREMWLVMMLTKVYVSRVVSLNVCMKDRNCRQAEQQASCVWSNVAELHLCGGRFVAQPNP